MKVVLDTNILVSGIGRPGRAPGQIISAWLEGTFDLVVPEALVAEFNRVLLYPRIRKLLLGAGLSNDDIQDFVDILRLKAFSVGTDRVVLPVTPTDGNDRHVLEVLIASGADYLVTGDKKHLLSLGMKNVVTAGDFANRLQAFKSLAPAIAQAPDLLSRVKKKRSAVARKDKEP
jgi:putative PIN family toxin of toxin-antitoxin system